MQTAFRTPFGLEFAVEYSSIRNRNRHRVGPYRQDLKGRCREHILTQTLSLILGPTRPSEHLHVSVLGFYRHINKHKSSQLYSLVGPGLFVRGWMVFLDLSSLDSAFSPPL